MDKILQQNPGSLAANEARLDSFWAPSQESSKKKGFNGVATFARKGLTLSADREVLGDYLDREGRCILTRHHHFVLFNVYTPNDGPWSRALPLKMRFLEALRQAMQRERALGRRVILAGDLNIQRRHLDCHWKRRMVDVTTLMRLTPPQHPKTTTTTTETDDDANATTMSPQELFEEARRFLQDGGWEKVRSALSQRQFRKCKVKASSQNRSIEKWRVVVKGADGKDVFLGRPFESEGQAKGAYDDYSVTERTVASNEGDGGGLENVKYIARPPNQIRVDQLAECVRVITGKKWSEALLREISEHHSIPRSSPCCLQWMNSIMRVDKMVDSFAALRPHARGRYTCWDQYKNGRYQNQGARIDYIFVDQSLWEKGIVVTGPSLYGTPPPPRTAPASTTTTATIATSTNSNSNNNIATTSTAPSTNQLNTTPFSSCDDAVAAAAAEQEEEDALDSKLLADTICNEEVKDMVGKEVREHNQKQHKKCKEGVMRKDEGKVYSLKSAASSSFSSSSSSSSSCVREEEKHALDACTAYGRWRMAPFAGGGLPDGTQSDYDTQFCRPHTGIIYTPPQYSDHIGVSLLLRICDSSSRNDGGEQGNSSSSSSSSSLKSKPPADTKTKFDKSTRKCQPHKKQLRLDSFFRPKTTKAIAAPVTGRENTQRNSSSRVEERCSQKRKKGIHAFFQPKSKHTKNQ